jgi:DNA-directed RNA polymerase subunit RPC12/RpoP
MPIILDHQSLGAECRGCIIALERGDGISDLIWNKCGERIRTVTSGDVERELARLAETCGYNVYPCVHCGALNICTEIAFTDALVCPRCRTGMVRSSG